MSTPIVSAKTAAANLRALAEAGYTESTSDEAVYPYLWFREHLLFDGSYQEMYSKLTGRSAYPGLFEDNPNWLEILSLSYSELPLLWLFFAAAIESGDL